LAGNSTELESEKIYSTPDNEGEIVEEVDPEAADETASNDEGVDGEVVAEE